jgi:hypothetical protein
VADLAAEGRAQAAEVLVLAVAARDHDQRPGHALHGGEGRADVGALGVVDVAHAAHVRDPLRAVRQAGEGAERVERRAERQRQRLGHRQRGHRVGGVVQALQPHRAERQQRLAPPQQHRRRRLLQRIVRCPRLEAERHHRLPGTRHLSHQRVVGVDHRHLAAVEDAGLGRRVGLERVVAVHVVGRDVQHRGGRGAQRMRGLELEAR